jgi:hypothetical protein
MIAVDVDANSFEGSSLFWAIHHVCEFFEALIEFECVEVDARPLIQSCSQHLHICAGNCFMINHAGSEFFMSMLEMTRAHSQHLCICHNNFMNHNLGFGMSHTQTGGGTTTESTFVDLLHKLHEPNLRVGSLSWKLYSITVALAG